MKKFLLPITIFLVPIICMLGGIAIGSALALRSSVKKTMDVASSLPSAIEKMGDYSDMDIAIIIRAFRASKAGKSVHTDKAVARYLARYYQQRSSLSEDEKYVLGATPSLQRIEELRKESPELNEAFEKLEKETEK